MAKVNIALWKMQSDYHQCEHWPSNPNITGFCWNKFLWHVSLKSVLQCERHGKCHCYRIQYQSIRGLLSSRSHLFVFFTRCSVRFLSLSHSLTQSLTLVDDCVWILKSRLQNCERLNFNFNLSKLKIFAFVTFLRQCLYLNFVLVHFQPAHILMRWKTI